MKSRYIWAIGVGLLVGLSAGCDQNKNQPPVTVTPTPPPPAPAPYQEPSLAPVEPPAPPVAAAPKGGDQYTPPDETTPIPPEEKPVRRSHAAKSSHAGNHEPAPRNHYARSTPKSGQSYTVKKGDTLQEISQKYYGTTKKWRRIYDANRDKIKGGPEKIAPGMKLVIPGK